MRAMRAEDGGAPFEPLIQHQQGGEKAQGDHKAREHGKEPIWLG